jgi:hypothetical protein
VRAALCFPEKSPSNGETDDAVNGARPLVEHFQDGNLATGNEHTLIERRQES